jgi:hypothetical protein
MIKEVLSSPTSTKENAQIGKSSKEDKAAEENPQEKGLFGMILQSVQQIKEELRPNGEATEETGGASSEPEVGEMRTDKNIIAQSAQSAEVSNTEEHVEQPLESTEDVTKMKLSVAKIAQESSDGSKNIKAIADEKAVRAQTEGAVTATQTDSETPLPISKKRIEPLKTAPILGTIGMDNASEMPAEAGNVSPLNVESPAGLKPVQQVGVMESVVSEGVKNFEAASDFETDSDTVEVLKEGLQSQEMGGVSSGSSKAREAMEALKMQEKQMQKGVPLKEITVQKAEPAAEDGKAETKAVDLGAGATKSPEETPEFTGALLHSKAEETRAKHYRQLRFSNKRGMGENNRLTLITDQTATRNASGQRVDFSLPSTANLSSTETDSGINLTKDQEMLLKEQMVETTEVKEHKQNDKFNMGYMRLGEMPISNFTIRRNVLPGLTQIMRASTQGKEIPETWQKHSFELEDGNKIQLSTRNVDGVIQVKLASSSMELSKLMQTHGQDIKSHLEQECDLNINLQFDNQPEQSMDNFFGDSSASPQRQGHASGRGANLRGSAQQVMEQPIQQSVRKFGYNQMEWTV